MSCFLFYFCRELKKAQMAAKVAAEERALFTDRMATRSTTQSNRTSRLIGKKMNRSVSLTIYWTAHIPTAPTKKKLWQEEARLKSLLESTLHLLCPLGSVVFLKCLVGLKWITVESYILTWLCQAFVSSSRLFHVGCQSLLDVPPAFAGLTTVVVCCLSFTIAV